MIRWLRWKVIQPACANNGWWGLLKVYLARVMKCVCKEEEYEGQTLRLRQTARSPLSTSYGEERWTRRFSCNDSYSLCHLEGQADQVNSQPLIECQSPPTGCLACPLKSRGLSTLCLGSSSIWYQVTFQLWLILSLSAISHGASQFSYKVANAGTF